MPIKIYEDSEEYMKFQDNNEHQNNNNNNQYLSIEQIQERISVDKSESFAWATKILYSTPSTEAESVCRVFLLLLKAVR